MSETQKSDQCGDKQHDALRRIVARIDAWAAIPGSRPTDVLDALLEVGMLARRTLECAPPSAGASTINAQGATARPAERGQPVIGAPSSAAPISEKAACDFVDRWLWEAKNRSTSGQPWMPTYKSDAARMCMEFAASLSTPSATQASDSARLDWMEKNNTTFDMVPGGCLVWPDDGPHSVKAENLRAAIDAAIAATAPRGEQP